MAYYDVHFVYNTKNVLLNFYMETEDRREIEESHRAIKKQNLYQEQKKYLNTFTS